MYVYVCVVFTRSSAPTPSAKTSPPPLPAAFAAAEVVVEPASLAGGAEAEPASLGAGAGSPSASSLSEPVKFHISFRHLQNIGELHHQGACHS